jgi:glycosyltransferase involved in cell wall biosynthesis
VRILYLSDFCPWPLDNGFRQRIYHLVQSLSRKHEVTLATVMPDAMRGQPFPPATNCVELIPLSDADCAFRNTGAFERWAPARQRLSTLVSSPYPNLVRRYRSPEILRTLIDLYRRNSFDVVWAERPFIAELARSAGFGRIVIDLPDVETVSYQRALSHSRWYPSKPLHLLELAKLYAYDQALPLRFWRLIVCKEEDRLFYRLSRSNVVTLPNGVEDHPASPGVPTGPAPQVMFVGALNFESNVEAISYFAGSVLPLIRREYPGVQFVVIGRDPIPAVLELQDRHACRVLTGVSDLTPHFDAASLFVAPIRLGSGTRLKVLEAMARGKPVVATSIAAEGLDVRSGIDLEIADSAEAFAAACNRLLGDGEARRRMAASGRSRVLERYRWEALTEIAEAALSERPQDRRLAGQSPQDDVAIPP